MTTIFPLDLDAEVTFTIDPGEPEIRYYPGRTGGPPNGDGNPGCPPSVEVESVMLGKIDILPSLTDAQLEQIVKIILEDRLWQEDP